MKWMLLALAICPGQTLETTGYFCPRNIVYSDPTFYNSLKECEAAGPKVVEAAAENTPSAARPFTSAWFCQAVHRVDFAASPATTAVPP